MHDNGGVLASHMFSSWRLWGGWGGRSWSPGSTSRRTQDAVRRRARTPGRRLAVDGTSRPRFWAEKETIERYSMLDDWRIVCVCPTVG
jgi:hypothetical protein